MFDRYEEIGGLLTFGIPPFKLEKQVMATRRAVLEAMGVQFHLGVEIGRERTIESLFSEFDAVFAATGAYRYVDAQLPGQSLPGVSAGVAFSGGQWPACSRYAITCTDWPIAGWSQPAPDLELAGKRVVVLGGGDTGMDCVRTSIRLGAASVTCIYRRDEAAMPGSRREVKNAKG